MSLFLIIAFGSSAAVLVLAMAWNVLADGSDMDRPSGKIGFIAYLAGMTTVLIGVLPHLLSAP